MYLRQPLPLTEFISNLETFDIVIMKGILITSIEAQAVTNSNWSHAGMVVLAGDIGIADLDPNTRLYWEANTADTAIDYLSNSFKAGPQLVLLEDRIVHNYWINYDGAFMARKLFCQRSPGMIDALKNAINQAKGGTLPYTGKDQTAELTNFMMGRFYNMPSTAGTFSCSQLVAYTLMEVGLLSSHYVSNSYVPADFTEEVDVSLLNGAWLGREITLDNKTIPPVDPNYKPYSGQ
jgi:hypothetical protein